MMISEYVWYPKAHTTLNRVTISQGRRAIKRYFRSKPCGRGKT